MCTKVNNQIKKFGVILEYKIIFLLNKKNDHSIHQWRKDERDTAGNKAIPQRFQNLIVW